MPSPLEDPKFTTYMRDRAYWPSTPSKLDELRFDAYLRAQKIRSQRFAGRFPMRRTVTALLAGTITLGEFQGLYPRLVRLTRTLA